MNLSLQQGVFPKAWKTSVVKPLYKGKSRMEILNYRPVSLLPVLSKILEQLVHARLNKFLVKEKTCYSGQYGFTKNKSCSDAIADLIGNIVEGFDNKQITLALFLDMSKSFDTIKYDILFKTLDNYGIRGLALDLFNSYPSERRLCVEINNTRSEFYKVEYGTEQGSVLGPIFYNLLTNNLRKQLRYFQCIYLLMTQQYSYEVTPYIS